MGTALSEFRARARLEYPGLDIDLENGFSIRLRSVTELDDDELGRFSEAQAQLERNDEGNDLAEARRSFVNVLAEVSDNPDATRAAFQREDLGTLTMIFKEYSSALSDTAAKSGEVRETTG